MGRPQRDGHVVCRQCDDFHWFLRGVLQKAFSEYSRGMKPELALEASAVSRPGPTERLSGGVAVSSQLSARIRQSDARAARWYRFFWLADGGSLTATKKERSCEARSLRTSRPCCKKASTAPAIIDYAWCWRTGWRTTAIPSGRCSFASQCGGQTSVDDQLEHRLWERNGANVGWPRWHRLPGKVGVSVAASLARCRHPGPGARCPVQVPPGEHAEWVEGLGDHLSRSLAERSQVTRSRGQARIPVSPLSGPHFWRCSHTRVLADWPRLADLTALDLAGNAIELRWGDCPRRFAFTSAISPRFSTWKATALDQRERRPWHPPRG